MNRAGIQLDHLVELRAVITMQRAPVSHGLIPVAPLRCKRTTLDVIDGGVISRHHTGTCTGFDGHVADGHAAFHRQTTDGATGKLNRIARTACRADLANDGEHDVFSADAFAKRTFNADEHRLGFFGNQSLRRQYVFNFRRADAESQRGKRAMR